MQFSPRASRAIVLAAFALFLGAAGCGIFPSSSFVPDQPPTLTLTSGPVDTVSSPQSWLVTIAWTASDPDGRIDHFEYALDPPPLRTARMALAETSWVRTTATSVTARFRAAHADSLVPGATASDFHVFVLRAFDSRGGASPLLVRAFYARTVAPDVQIVRPVPSIFLIPEVPVPFRVEWRGHDPDGEGTGNPTAYRIRLLDLNDPYERTYLLDPDSLLHEGAANGWQDWRTIGGDTTSLVLTTSDIVPGQSMLLAVLAVDAAGATTPYLTFDRNFLNFNVGPGGGAAAPRIHISSRFVDFTYDSGGYSLDPLRWITVEVPAHLPLEFCFDAIAAPGRATSGSRWMLDGDIADETPRSGPSDVSHWSDLLPPSGCIELPGLDPGEHRLYVEVSDDFGDKSLAIVKLTAVDVMPTHELLVVDDTRLEADKFLPTGCPGTYTRPWPSAAELDTFLYARGGVPWRCAQADPTATSVPGLLAGYAFDTLGTRLGLENPANAVPLSRLARYRHVLWFVDQRSAQGGAALGQTTALEAMSHPGAASSLAAYVAAGGEVWLAGGGAALASLIRFNRVQNDTCGTLFTATDGELVPGRIMYDAAHVRSALAVGLSGAEPQRSPAARGGWSGGGPSGTLTAPDYSHLPAALRFRSPATDPLPPTRMAGQAGMFYTSNTADEYVSAPNEVTEPVDPHTAPPVLQSTLDTLYDLSSSQLCVSPAPAMLYYHGRDNAPFVFTGFDLWSWSRSDAQGLVDFVLGDIWGMARSGPRAAGSASVQDPAGGRRPLRSAGRPHRVEPSRSRR